MPETWSPTILDHRASKTICREEWLTQYINNLKNTDQQKVMFGESNHIYRLGDGKKVKAIYSAKIPAVIETDVVNNETLLLFSKTTMKKDNMKLNFQNNTINIFNENIPLITTNILITKAKQMINNLERENDMNILHNRQPRYP